MRVLIFCLFLLPVISVAGQPVDSARIKLAAGIGWSYPIGLCAHAQMLPLKKFGVGILIEAAKWTSADDWNRIYYDSSHATVGTQVTRMNPTGFLSVSAMGTVYALGKNRDSRAALTLSSGFGILIKKHSWNVTGSGTTQNGQIISSYDGVKISSGLSFLVSLGAEFRVWKGSFFLEMPFVFYAGKVNTKYSYTNLSGPAPPSYFFIYERGLETLGTSYLSAGYKVFF